MWFPGCDVKLDLNLTYADYDSRGACSGEFMTANLKCL